MWYNQSTEIVTETKMTGIKQEEEKERMVEIEINLCPRFTRVCRNFRQTHYSIGNLSCSHSQWSNSVPTKKKSIQRLSLSLSLLGALKGITRFSRSPKVCLPSNMSLLSALNVFSQVMYLYQFCPSLPSPADNNDAAFVLLPYVMQNQVKLVCGLIFTNEFGWLSSSLSPFPLLSIQTVE